MTGLSCAGELSQARLEALEDIDPGWSMTPCPADVPLRAAPELCPRSVIVSGGVIAAGGPTGGIVGFVSSSTA